MVRKRLENVSPHQVQVSSFFHQPGRGPDVSGGRGSVTEGACVLVDAHQHQGGVDPSRMLVRLFHELLNQECSAGACTFVYIFIAVRKDVPMRMVVPDDHILYAGHSRMWLNILRVGDVDAVDLTLR